MMSPAQRCEIAFTRTPARIVWLGMVEIAASRPAITSRIDAGGVPALDEPLHRGRWPVSVMPVPTVLTGIPAGGGGAADDGGGAPGVDDGGEGVTHGLG